MCQDYVAEDSKPPSPYFGASWRAAIVVLREEAAEFPKGFIALVHSQMGLGLISCISNCCIITAVSPWGVSADSLQTEGRKAALHWQMCSNSSQALGSSEAMSWPLLMREEKEKTGFDQHTVVSSLAYSTMSWGDKPVSRWKGRYQSCMIHYLSHTSHCHRDWNHLCKQLLTQAGEWRHHKGTSLLHLVLPTQRLECWQLKLWCFKWGDSLRITVPSFNSLIKKIYSVKRQPICKCSK